MGLLSVIHDEVLFWSEFLDLSISASLLFVCSGQPTQVYGISVSPRCLGCSSE